MIFNPAKAGPRGAETFLLEIFLTNRCNLNCSYCSSRYMIDESCRRALSFEQVRRAVDAFAAYGRRPGGRGERTIFFTGGEPLLEYDVLKRGVEYIRGLKERFRVRVATNATLLTPERARFLLDNNVRIFVSLDGDKREHDRHRVFRGGRSSFGAIMRNLRAVKPAELAGPGFCVSATLTADTIASLPRTMDFFSRLGIGVIEICPEAYEVWSPARIAATMKLLRQVARGRLLRRLGEAAGRGQGPQFIFSNSSAPDNNKWSLEDYYETLCHNVSFMYDGYFYPCETVFGTELDARYRVGDPERGIDAAKVRRVYGEAVRRLARYGESVGTSLTAGRYYYALNKGLAQEPYFENARAVGRAFEEALGGFLKAQRVHDSVTARPGFGDFPHQPRLRSGREAQSLRLTVSDGAAGAARAALDYFLYSPGARKRLALRPENAGRGTRELAEGLALYAAAKAGRLGRKLRVELEPAPEGKAG